MEVESVRTLLKCTHSPKMPLNYRELNFVESPTLGQSLALESAIGVSRMRSEGVIARRH